MDLLVESFVLIKCADMENTEHHEKQPFIFTASRRHVQTLTAYMTYVRDVFDGRPQHQWRVAICWTLPARAHNGQQNLEIKVVVRVCCQMRLPLFTPCANSTHSLHKFAFYCKANAAKHISLMDFTTIYSRVFIHEIWGYALLNVSIAS